MEQAADLLVLRTFVCALVLHATPTRESRLALARAAKGMIEALIASSPPSESKGLQEAWARILNELDLAQSGDGPAH